MPEQKASLRPAHRGPTARSWHIVGLASAPFPGSRVKAPVTFSERHPVLLVLGHRTLTPLLPTPQCQRPTSWGDLETKAQIHTHHIPHTCTHTHPHTLTPTPTHTPQRTSLAGRGLSPTRGARLRGFVAAHRPWAGPDRCGRKAPSSHLRRNLVPTGLALSVPHYRTPPTSGPLWTVGPQDPEDPSSLFTGSPCPHVGTPNPSTALDLAYGTAELSPPRVPLSLITWTSLSRFTCLSPTCVCGTCWGCPWAQCWRGCREEVKLIVSGPMPPTRRWSHTVSRAVVGAC